MASWKDLYPDNYDDDGNFRGTGGHENADEEWNQENDDSGGGGGSYSGGSLVPTAEEQMAANPGGTTPEEYNRDRGGSSSDGGRATASPYASSDSYGTTYGGGGGGDGGSVGTAVNRAKSATARGDVAGFFDAAAGSTDEWVGRRQTDQGLARSATRGGLLDETDDGRGGSWISDLTGVSEADLRRRQEEFVTEDIKRWLENDEGGVRDEEEGYGEQALETTAQSLVGLFNPWQYASAAEAVADATDKDTVAKAAADPAKAAESAFNVAATGAANTAEYAAANPGKAAGVLTAAVLTAGTSAAARGGASGVTALSRGGVKGALKTELDPRVNIAGDFRGTTTRGASRLKGGASKVRDLPKRAPDISVRTDPDAGLLEVDPQLKKQIQNAVKPSIPSGRSSTDLGRPLPTDLGKPGVVETLDHAAGRARRAPGEARQGAQNRVDSARLSASGRRASAEERLNNVLRETPTSAGEVSDAAGRVRDRVAWGVSDARTGAELALRTAGPDFDGGGWPSPSMPDFSVGDPRERFRDARDNARLSASAKRASAEERLNNVLRETPTSAGEVSDAAGRVRDRLVWQVSDARTGAELALRTAGPNFDGGGWPSPSVPDLSGGRERVTSTFADLKDTTITIGPARPPRQRTIDVGDGGLTDEDLGDMDMGLDLGDGGQNGGRGAGGGFSDDARRTRGGQQIMTRREFGDDTQARGSGERDRRGGQSPGEPTLGIRPGVATGLFADLDTGPSLRVDPGTTGLPDKNLGPDLDIGPDAGPGFDVPWGSDTDTRRPPDFDTPEDFDTPGDFDTPQDFDTPGRFDTPDTDIPGTDYPGDPDRDNSPPFEMEGPRKKDLLGGGFAFDSKTFDTGVVQSVDEIFGRSSGGKGVDDVFGKLNL